MKRIVINRCYGGFSLSPAGVANYYGRKGRKAHFFRSQLDGGVSMPISMEAAESTLLWYAFDSETPPVEPAPGEWARMTMDERMASNAAYSERHLDSSPKSRHDPDLIATVEALGEKANGRCAELAIVEIPDGVEYEIEEYDGQEWVAESHRAWR